MSHGNPPGELDDPQGQPWYEDDPEMWSGLYGSMTAFLAMERAQEDE